MNYGQTIFSQLMDFMPAYEFNQCVKRHNGNYKIKNFTCREQFLCMAFAQLTYRESLRDIQACLRTANKKLGFLTNNFLLPALMDCDICVCACCHSQETPQPESEFVCNYRDFKCLSL